MSRVRKAVTAGVLAALTLIGTKIYEGGTPANGPEWITLLGAAAGAAITAGVATYLIPNRNTVNGSEPGQV